MVLRMFVSDKSVLYVSTMWRVIRDWYGDGQLLIISHSYSVSFNACSYFFGQYVIYVFVRRVILAFMRRRVHLNVRARKDNFVSRVGTNVGVSKYGLLLTIHASQFRIGVARSRIANGVRVRLIGLIYVVCINAYAMVRYVPFLTINREGNRFAIRSVRLRTCVRFIFVERTRWVVNRCVRVTMVTVANARVSKDTTKLYFFSNVKTRRAY